MKHESWKNSFTATYTDEKFHNNLHIEYVPKRQHIENNNVTSQMELFFWRWHSQWRHLSKTWFNTWYSDGTWETLSSSGPISPVWGRGHPQFFSSRPVLGFTLYFASYQPYILRFHHYSASSGLLWTTKTSPTLRVQAEGWLYNIICPFAKGVANPNVIATRRSSLKIKSGQ